MAQSAAAMIIALSLVETVRDTLAVFRPGPADAPMPYVLMRVMATVVVIALVIAFVFLYPSTPTGVPVAPDYARRPPADAPRRYAP